MTAMTAPTSFRPGWVTEERVDSWRRWVFRDAAGSGTSVATAPYDGLPTAEVPAGSVDDVGCAPRPASWLPLELSEVA